MQRKFTLTVPDRMSTTGIVSNTKVHMLPHCKDSS